MSHKFQKAYDAVTPSNLTQSQTAPVGSAIAGAALSFGIGAGLGALDGVATTTLFRAVDSIELESIESTGQFLSSPNGTEYKGFFFERSDAADFAAGQENPSTVVSGKAPTDLVNSSPPHEAATEGPGVLIKNENLPQVTPKP